MVMHLHLRGRLNGAVLNIVGAPRTADVDTVAVAKVVTGYRVCRPVDQQAAQERQERKEAKRRALRAKLTPEERREVYRKSNEARNRRMGWKT